MSRKVVLVLGLIRASRIYCPGNFGVYCVFVLHSVDMASIFRPFFSLTWQYPTWPGPSLKLQSGATLLVSEVLYPRFDLPEYNQKIGFTFIAMCA